MRTLASITIAALALIGLTACNNGSCQAEGAPAALTIAPLKGGGGGGGGGHGSSGGGGHSSGEGAAGHGSEGSTGSHEGDSTSSSGWSTFHWPWTSGHGSTTCKQGNP